MPVGSEPSGEAPCFCRMPHTINVTIIEAAAAIMAIIVKAFAPVDSGASGKSGNEPKSSKGSNESNDSSSGSAAGAVAGFGASFFKPKPGRCNLMVGASLPPAAGAAGAAGDTLDIGAELVGLAPPAGATRFNLMVFCVVLAIGVLV